MVGNSIHLIYSANSLYLGKYFLVYFQFSVAKFMERDLSQETAIQKIQQKHNLISSNFVMPWKNIIIFNLLWNFHNKNRTILRSEKSVMPRQVGYGANSVFSILLLKSSNTAHFVTFNLCVLEVIHMLVNLDNI